VSLMEDIAEGLVSLMEDIAGGLVSLMEDIAEGLVSLREDIAEELVSFIHGLVFRANYVKFICLIHSSLKTIYYIVQHNNTMYMQIQTAHAVHIC